MDLKQIFEALDKGKGVQQQKALVALQRAIDKDMKLIDFEHFSTNCLYKPRPQQLLFPKFRWCMFNGQLADVALAGKNDKRIVFSECESETCPKWNLL